MFLNLEPPRDREKNSHRFADSESPFGKCMYALFGHRILLVHHSERLMVFLLLSPTLTGLVLNLLLSFII